MERGGPCFVPSYTRAELGRIGSQCANVLAWGISLILHFYPFFPPPGKTRGETNSADEFLQNLTLFIMFEVPFLKALAYV